MPANIRDLYNLKYLDISDCERLQSLPELPRGINVIACDCSSLELISDSSFLFSQYSEPQIVDFANCFKLDLRRVLHKESHQELCAGICFPGIDVPEWFSFQNAGSCITLEQSPIWDNRSCLDFHTSVLIFPEYRVDHHYNVVSYYCLTKSDDGKIEAYRDRIQPSFDFRRLYYPSYLRSKHVVLGFRYRMGRPIKVWEPLDEEYDLHMKKMRNSKFFIEFHAHGAKVQKCGVHFSYVEDCGERGERPQRSVRSDEEKEKDESESIKLQISFEEEYNLRPQVMSKFRRDLLSQSWKLKRNALRDIMKDALLNIQQNLIVWSKVEESTCENPKGCICFPGHDIPDWFNIQNAGDYLELPQGSLNRNFVGLAFCTVVAFQIYDDEINHDFLVNCELHLKSKNGFRKKVSISSMRGWFEGDRPYFIKSYNVFLGYHFDIYAQEFHELCYNSAAILKFYVSTYGYGVANFKLAYGCKVNKCGVRLFYTHDFGKSVEEPNKCFISNEKEESEEPHCKILESSNYCQGISSLRCGLHPLYEKERKEFSRRANQCSSFAFQDLNEVPQDFVGSTLNVGTIKRNNVGYDDAVSNGSDRFNDEEQTFCASAACDSQSNNFNFLNLSEFPCESAGSTKDVIGTTKRSFTSNDWAEPRGSGCCDYEGEPQPKRIKEFKFF